MTEAEWTILGGIIGGLGTKLIDRFFQRGKERVDEAAQFRKELRDEVAALRTEVRTLSTEVDTWRTKYYELMDKHNELKANYHEVHSELEEIKAQVQEQEH